jgi:hypothetical protein
VLPPTLLPVIPQPRTAAPSRAEVLATVLAMLARQGRAALPEVVALVVHADPSVGEIVVRAAPGWGGVLARATAATYDGDGCALDLPIRSRGRALGVLTVTTSQPATPGLAGVLAAVADALGLALAVERETQPGQALLDVEADLAALAAELDETVGAALVTLRHVEADQWQAAVTAALAACRQLRRDLRATALHGGLRAALAELSELGADVDADDTAIDGVPPAAAVLAERVAEGACRMAVGRPHVQVEVTVSMLKLCVESADNTVDASELARWRRRAHTLGGDLRIRPGGIELTLPTSP